MNTLLESGKYIIAVSGGVDSVVLLHMLTADKDLDLVVAHFDHGIRPDSADDANFVASLAEQYGLPFVTERVELGPDASEADARQKRYDFLQSVRRKNNAKAIATAHHQDDVIETALLNLVRGTKRRGLVSLKSTDEIKRPLLHMTKDEIKNYAVQNKLEWREDSTNQEQKYQRNKIRSIIKNSLTPENRQNIIKLLQTVQEHNDRIERATQEFLQAQPEDTLDKELLNSLPAELAHEVVAAWLRKNKLNFDTKTLERIVTGAKNLNNGSQIDVQQNHYCLLSKTQIVLKRR
jgi:tRNA(Ile)-lysidine synthase